MKPTKLEQQVEVLLNRTNDAKLEKENASKRLAELVATTIEKSRPLWGIHVKNAIEQFNERPNFVHNQRTHGRTTVAEREAIAHFAWNGIPAINIAQKFSVSLPTVYHYSYSEPNSYFSRFCEVELAEYRFKRHVGSNLFKQQKDS